MRTFKNRIQWQIQDFPWGGHGPVGGHGPPMRALFAENVCKNERIGSCRGDMCWPRPLDPPMGYSGQNRELLTPASNFYTLYKLRLKITLKTF